MGLLFALADSILAMPSSAWADEDRPAYLQIDQTGPTRYNVLWRIPMLSGMKLPIILRYSDGIRLVAGPNEQELPDSVVERSIIEVRDGLVGKRITFSLAPRRVCQATRRCLELVGSASSGV